MSNMRKEILINTDELIIGIDEVGRGPLAGTLVVCGVILNKLIDGLCDSKKLNSKRIDELNDKILKQAKTIHIEVVDVKTIDELGIKKAVLKAMENIVRKTEAKVCLLDFEQVKVEDKITISITKGDEKMEAISAASIVAKHYRDKQLIKLDSKYPNYGFKNHVGYGTKAHMEAIKTYGIIDGVHRESYKPIKEMR